MSPHHSQEPDPRRADSGERTLETRLGAGQVEPGPFEYPADLEAELINARYELMDEAKRERAKRRAAWPIVKKARFIDALRALYKQFDEEP